MRESMLLTWAWVLTVGMTSFSSAQTKISGTSQCPKPDQQHTLSVGDGTDHALAISKNKCTWTRPLQLEGLQSTQDEVTTFSDVSGTTATDRTYVVGTMSNGDKVFVLVEGKSTVKGGAFQSGSGTWTYTGGTGKFKGLKGKGTVTCKGSPDGTMTCNIEGVYQVAQ